MERLQLSHHQKSRDCLSMNCPTLGSQVCTSLNPLWIIFFVFTLLHSFSWRWSALKLCHLEVWEKIRHRTTFLPYFSPRTTFKDYMHRIYTILESIRKLMSITVFRILKLSLSTRVWNLNQISELQRTSFLPSCIQNIFYSLPFLHRLCKIQHPQNPPDQWWLG